MLPKNQFEESYEILKRKRISAFAITYLAYVAVHAQLTAWSFSISYFQRAVKCSDQYLGLMNSVFLFTYAISLKIIGSQGDRMHLRFFISFGMIGSSIAFLILGILCQQQIHNLYIFPFLIAFTGLFQSTIWPGLVATMGNWFGKGGRGLLMGVWVGNSNVGDMTGFAVFGQLTIITFNWGYQYCILVAGTILFLSGLVVLAFLEPYPKEFGLNVSEIDKQDDTQKGRETPKSINFGLNNENNLEDEPLIQQNPFSNIGYLSAWLVPGVAVYAITYFCLKSSAYVLLFWLPYYLDHNNLTSSSSYISAMFSLGNWIGGVFTGLASDVKQKRAIIMCPMLFISVIFLFIVKFSLNTNALPYYFIIFFIGFFMGGPYNIISAASSIDLAKQKSIKGNKAALATISGLIEGLGSLGAASVQLIIPAVGYQNIFYMLIVLCFLAGSLLVPYAMRDYRELKEEKQSKTTHALLV